MPGGARTRRTPGLRAVATLASAVVAGALFSPVPSGAAPQPATAQAPLELRVMEFNIEYGGFHVSWESTLEVIRRSGADVIGIEEGQGRVDALARDLGWPHFSERLQLLSRYPIVDPPGGDGRYVFIEVAPGEIVAMQNVHLPSNPYGPFRIRQGETRRQVLERERTLRLPAIEPVLDAAGPLIESGIPVFLVGDFNSPSWRDWTPEMVGVRPQIRYPVRWPVSLAVEDAGFVDSYRTVHPDPLEDPGITWPAYRPELPGWDPGKTAPWDRIDLVYAAGDATPTASELIGEPGGEGVDLTVDPWPTDHRAVMSTFTVTPAPMPPLVAVERRLVPVGADLAVRFHHEAPGGEIVLVPSGGDPTADALVAEPIPPGSADGTVTFDTTSMTPGAYEAVLVDTTGGEVSRIAFWVKEPGSGPVISTGAATYDVGEGIDVAWTNAPGNRWDWIGIYRRNRDPRIRWYLLWTYTGATVAGSATLDESARGPWPLPAGRYSVYLLQDDGYRKLAGADFDIVE